MSVIEQMNINVKSSKLFTILSLYIVIDIKDRQKGQVRISRYKKRLKEDKSVY
jgi:hypothetical protein